MALLSKNPARNFSAGYGEPERVEQLLAGSAAPLDDLFDDPVVRERVGKLIAEAIRQWAKSD